MQNKDFRIYKNVFVGKGVHFQKGVIVGQPPFNVQDGELETIIGEKALIRSNTVIYAGTKIGDNFQTGHNVVVRERNRIGDNCSIWSNSIISPGNFIGDNVKIHCSCFVEESILENDVFLGPHVVLTDDLHPVCPKWKECMKGARIMEGAVIGANVTILPGTTVGKGALVGAGSVIIRDVPNKVVVVGNPAKIIKKVEELRCKKGFYHVPYEWREK